MSLFDQKLAEVKTDEGIRYVLRRNPLRAQEVAASRESKLASLRREVEKQNRYLREHARASVKVALRKVQEKCKTLRLSGWVMAGASGQTVTLVVDEDAIAEAAKLDGCYVLKTDLTKEMASKEVIHDRYRDLALVEQAFRTCKTVGLEVRPVHVRRAERTRGHAFVVMLAYRIIQHLAECWRNMELTVKEGVDELSQLCAIEMLVNRKPCCNQIPEPRESAKNLLELARVRLPEILPCKGIRVATRKKLTANRKTR
jgi:transposase